MIKEILKHIKGHEYNDDGEKLEKVDDSYIIWYDVLIGMMAVCLIGVAIGTMLGFILWWTLT